MSLATKYRPRTFEDVKEQGAVVEVLRKQIEEESHKNTYLFTGGAGTGKTTLARIMANEINGGKGTPIEIDAASNNGVDNVREISEDAKTQSISSKYKVFIIDECHMLSTGAWNAMLKLIEEPPAKTVFTFCTTDPQKIPNTILSRVFRFDFKRISHDGIVERLEYILEQEHAELYNADEKTMEEHYGRNYKVVIDYIAKVADGGMRDAITLLDKVLSHTYVLELETATAILGQADYEKMVELTYALILFDTVRALKVIDTVHANGVDLKQFMKSYMEFVLNICKFYLYGDFKYITVPDTYIEVFEEWTDQPYETFSSLLPSIQALNNEIKWEQNPKTLIQATLVYLTSEVE